MASVIPGFVVVGVYRSDANSTLEAYSDAAPGSFGTVDFRKFPKLRLKNDYTSFVLDTSRLNNLALIQYAGHNLLSSVSNDEKLIVTSSS